MNEQPSQRADVESKYDFIYSALAQVTDTFMARPAATPLETYGKLRHALSGTWATIHRLTQESRNRGSNAVEFSALLAAITEYNMAPCTWIERGHQRHGQRHEFDDAFGRIVTDTLLQHIPGDCDLILDLGCGWGHRMFDVWLGNGPRGAKYVGGDRSQHSAHLVKRIAPLFPKMPVDWFYFDFLQPNFMPLGKDYKNVAVFTVHAIEQVRHLGAALFDRLTEQFPQAQLRGIHLEPIGFQFEEARSRYPDSIAVDQAYAERRQYNVDLVHQVQTHDKLAIVAAETGLIGSGQGNSTSTLVWTLK